MTNCMNLQTFSAAATPLYADALESKKRSVCQSTDLKV
nr:MAG TPA: hypothetical protein [Caudoviricetes sp.]